MPSRCVRFRLGSAWAQDVAAAVVWRCSDQASLVTGATLRVDGSQHDSTKPPQMYVSLRTAHGGTKALSHPDQGGP